MGETSHESAQQTEAERAAGARAAAYCNIACARCVYTVSCLFEPSLKIGARCGCCMRVASALVNLHSAPIQVFPQIVQYGTLLVPCNVCMMLRLLQGVRVPLTG
jgi:hypothetical protein